MFGKCRNNGVLNLKQHVGMFAAGASIRLKGVLVLVLQIIWYSYKHGRGEVSVTYNFSLLMFEYWVNKTELNQHVSSV